MRTAVSQSENGGTRSISGLRGLIRDYHDALQQQMYLWGRDVIHPDGNLLVKAGFERHKSEGLDGTSCYRKNFEGSRVELHGACVGRYEREGPGFLFVRSRKASFLFEDFEPPAPGLYPATAMSSGPLSDLYRASCRFLHWWLDYEMWIRNRLGSTYRDQCFRAFRKLPRSKEWLPPETGRAWLRKYSSSPERLQRVKEWKRENTAR